MRAVKPHITSKQSLTKGLQQLQKLDSLSFYSYLIWLQSDMRAIRTQEMEKLIPPHPSGGITEKPLGNNTAGEARRSKKNELASPLAVSQPQGSEHGGGGERQDWLAPANMLATTPVPRWSKRQAKVQPCHKGSTAPYTAAAPSFPSPLARSLLARGGATTRAS
jgi:hypothetical protein